MVLQNRETDPGPDDSVSTPSGPGQGPMGAAWIVIVALYLVVASVAVLYGLIKLWPYPTPSGEAKVEAKASASPTPTVQTTTQATAPAGQIGAGTPATRGTAATTPTTNAGTAPAPSPSPSPAATPSPSPTPPKRALPDPEVITFFGGFSATIYLETRLLLLVMLAGALGSLMHSLRSLYWYTGNRMMVWSWVGYYLLLPFTGAMLSVIFYFVVRGGFFSPQASFDNTSPFGFAALSALVGLFSPQATLKLKEVAETIFTKPGAGANNKPQPTQGEAQAGAGGAAAPGADTEAVDEADVHDLDLKPDTPDEDLPITQGGVAK